MDTDRILEALRLLCEAGLREGFAERVINDPAYRNRLVAAELEEFSCVKGWPLEFREFPTWHTVQVGVKKTLRMYVEAAWAAYKSSERFRFNIYTQKVCEKVKFEKEPRELALVKVSLRDLGFTKNHLMVNGEEKWITHKEVFQRARELGLGLCPPDVGLALLVQPPLLEEGWWASLGMEPIIDRGAKNIFALGVERDRYDRDRHVPFLDVSGPAIVDPDDAWIFIQK